MFIDARRVPEEAIIECDICIIGAGAAGITLARQFAETPAHLCVLESGDLEIDSATQDLYAGENVGLSYFDLDVCRLRFFGGTTNHWAGYCLPFKERDFAERPWLPGTGWPIGLRDLEPYYGRAADELNLPSGGWQLDYWEEKSGQARLPLDSDRLASDLLLINPVRMGSIHRQQFAGSPNIDTYLNANVVEIETDEAARQVTGVQVRTLAGNGFRVAGTYVVLAAGGIENPRLLLASNRVQKAGLGNHYDLVGRYFMEDPGFIGAIIKPADPGLDTDLYRRRHVDQTNVRAYLHISEETQRESGIEPVAILLEPVPDPRYETDGIQSLLALRRQVRAGQWPNDLAEQIANVMGDFGSVATLAYRSLRYGEFPPIDRIDCRLALKVVPNPDSRVTLGDERDELGQRRVRLDWRLSEIDKRSARRAVEILAAEVGRSGLGRVQSLVDNDDTTWPEDLEGVYHHMGTTRMADDPHRGVVDRDSKVHGIANLYVAGSSVFATSGSGTPTITIMSLAIRLADHLKEKLA